MSALAALSSLLVAVSPTPPIVAVEAADPVLRGALALALVEDGVVVVPRTATAGVVLRALVEHEGVHLATIGASERTATVAAGSPALVELEAVHRALALVRATPPRAAEAPAGVFLDIDDRAPPSTGGSARLAEGLAAALLDAEVPLADAARAAERLCVIGSAAELAISWGTSAARCDGRPIGLARADLSAARVVDEALRLRAAAPLPRPPPSTAAPSLPDGDLAATMPASAPEEPPVALPAPPGSPAPALASQTPSLVDATPVAAAPAPVAASLEARAAPPAAATATLGPALDARVGALGRSFALDPALEAELVWPLVRGAGVGPAAWLAASGALEPLALAELALAGGVGGRWRLGDDVRATAALVAGAWLHGWSWSEVDAGVALDAVVALPLTVAWQPGPLGLSLSLTPGAMTRSRTHQIYDEPVWQRGALFLGLFAGLTWDIPAGATPVENSEPRARGERDG